jgi:hypothetical protein
LAFFYAYKTKKQIVELADFSGKGGLFVYNMIADVVKFEMSSKSNDASKIAQIVFHGMFGSYLANLKDLEVVTDCPNFFTRRELDDAFKVNETVNQSIEDNADELTTIYTEFKLIKFKYFSKLKSSNISKFTSAPEPTRFCQELFIGFKRRQFTEDDLRKLRSIEATAHVSSGPAGTQRKVQMILNGLEADQTKLIDIGTTKWFKGYTTFAEAENKFRWVDTDTQPIFSGDVKSFF